MDLDFSTELEHLLEVEKLIYHYNFDLIVGSRRLKSSRIIGRKFHRTLLSNTLNLIIKFLFLSKITDGMCGFKFLKKEIFENINNSGANHNGWIFCTELLLVGEFLRYRIKEIPVIWTDDRNSKVKIFDLIKEYLIALFKLRIRFIINSISLNN